ncbi:LOW QUALITY PROTEIN: Oligomerisation domain-containing protein [Cephalotus follicularis]|uniref:Oligomerisation domain-containing protein n=1 Tax=Cephalotus follicularis TaxID=3775 RepID=A0A1Q3DDC3_CEPFO|nr:LOW QUALITY PROTEIN: Oligomerisation domain-containing protein [Cephalotus follicularis]
MWSALRSGSFHRASSQSLFSLGNQSWKLGFSNLKLSFSSSSTTHDDTKELLSLEEVEKVLSDVRADNVTVIPVKKQLNWADFMVIATGRSTWHVKNIAQALIHKAGLCYCFYFSLFYIHLFLNHYIIIKQAKQKQKGAERLMLPTVEGQEAGKWVVVDSGKVIVHALDEKARAYYNLESLWASDASQLEPVEDLGSAFMKVRRINNSKRRPAQKSV